MHIRSSIMKSRYITYASAACTAVVLYVALTHLDDLWGAVGSVYYFVAPLIGGFILAYLLNPVANFFSERCFRHIKNRRVARGLGVAATMLALLGAIIFLAASLIPQLVDSINKLADGMDGYMESARNTLEAIKNKTGSLNIDFDKLSASWEGMVGKMVKWVPSNLNIIIDASYKIGSSLFNSIVVTFIAIYLLMDKERIIKGFKRLSMALLPGHTYERLSSFLFDSNSIFIRYIGSNLLDGLIIGVANFLFLIIFRMPYPLLIAVISGLANLIPTFGPIIGAIPCGLIILLVSPSKALWFVIWTVLIQAVDAYVIKPLLYGDSMDLVPVWVLVSIIVGGRVLGFIGILIGIPVAAILSLVIKRFVTVRLQQKGIKTE